LKFGIWHLFITFSTTFARKPFSIVTAHATEKKWPDDQSYQQANNPWSNKQKYPSSFLVQFILKLIPVLFDSKFDEIPSIRVKITYLDGKINSRCLNVK
jgi:hypothetical protein